MKLKILKKTFKFNLLTALLIFIALNLLILNIAVFKESGFDKLTAYLSEKRQAVEREQIFEEINPSQGYDLGVSYSDLGPKMVSMGVIDIEKFRSIYSQRGGFTDQELKILTSGSNERIRITRENSGFLLNFFWALGLANNTRILTSGEMQNYGGNPSNFASTGGWTVSKENSMNYYSKAELIKLTKAQEDLVEKVASGIFRPCCDNSTAFPDCNHGMALLAVLELMAANGATEDKMFEAAKYFNAYWFPSNYYDLASYFRAKEGKKFDEVRGEVILGKDYSSASGYSQIKQWLIDKGEIKQPADQGASCGV